MTPGRINAVDIPAEILLLIVTITATRTFERVFLDGSFSRPLLTTAIVVHLVLFVTRRLRGGLLLSFLTSLVALVLQITATFFGDTSSFGLPTGRTSDAFTTSLREGWQLFQEVTAPAPVATGFLVGASFAIWAVAFLADWAAFRLRTPGEALVPSVAILIFIGLFGLEAGRLSHVTLYLAAALAFLLAHRAAARVSTGNWLGGSIGRAYGALVSVGAVVALLALLVGVRGAPALPWADQAAVFEWRSLGDDGPGSRKVISPLVDIRGRMVNQQADEMFTVRTDKKSYWRLTSLDRFNGGVWTSEGDYTSAGDDLPVSFPSDAASDLVTQEFTITGLSELWLPTAYQAVAFETDFDLGASYEPDAATLIIGSSVERTGEPIQYTVQSDVPRLDQGFLSALRADGVDAKYRELPEGFSENVRQQAIDITAGAVTDFEKATALQNYFRDNFTYNIDVLPGHSEQVIEQFLTTQEGYCEQFAGTYAAMARSLGLPARVAVGFTYGDLVEGETNVYQVRGEHGHAWPEVYLDGAGWVLFEPTPGRGAPGASSYLPDVAEAQQGSVGGASNEAAEIFDNPTPGPGDPTLPTPVGGPQQPPIEPEFPETEFIDEVEPLPWWRTRTRLVRSLIAATLLALAYASIPFVKTARRRRALAATEGQPRNRIDVAWRNVVEDFEPHGLRRADGETNTEFASRAADLVQSRADQIHELGHVATLATFAPEDPSQRDAEQAVNLGQSILDGLNEKITISQRLRILWDPRPLLPPRLRALRLRR